MGRLAFVLLALCAPWTASAEAPRVVADIPPVHGLVARVMAGVGAPDLLLPPGTSPHVHSMRPSQAAALEGAALVFWVGPELTPWLERPLSSIAGSARKVALLDAGGTAIRPYRWNGEDHHGDADDHDHAHGHTAGAPDPHAWMDPQNAAAWMSAIAMALSEADPANAAVYAANATAGQAELAELLQSLAVELAPLHDIRMILFHDALQYFEARFGLSAIGAMTDGESAPTPRHIAELRDLAGGDVCIVLEPQADPGLARAVGIGAPVVTVDLQGRDLMPGPGYYPALLRNVAAALGGCRDG